MFLLTKADLRSRECLEITKKIQDLNTTLSSNQTNSGPSWPYFDRLMRDDPEDPERDVVSQLQEMKN